MAITSLNWWAMRATASFASTVTFVRSAFSKTSSPDGATEQGAYHLSGGARRPARAKVLVSRGVSLASLPTERINEEASIRGAHPPQWGAGIVLLQNHIRLV